MKLTTREVAKSIGVTPYSVLRNARKRRVKPVGHIGAALLWSREQVEQLAPGKAGRPRKEEK